MRLALRFKGDPQRLRRALEGTADLAQGPRVGAVWTALSAARRLGLETALGRGAPAAVSLRCDEQLPGGRSERAGGLRLEPRRRGSTAAARSRAISPPRPPTPRRFTIAARTWPKSGEPFARARAGAWRRG